MSIKCVFWFSLQLLSETFLILRGTERDMIINLLRASCKVPVILVRFQWNMNFLDRFSKNTQISSFIKLRPVGAKVFHADGWTDMTKLTVAFRNFANAPKTPYLFVPSYNNSRMYMLLMITILWQRNEREDDDIQCLQFSTCSYTGDVFWSVITPSEVLTDPLLLSPQNG
jgi:hypothetical protein